MVVNRLRSYLSNNYLNDLPFAGCKLSLDLPQSYILLVRAKLKDQLTRREIRALEETVKLHKLVSDFTWN